VYNDQRVRNKIGLQKDYALSVGKEAIVLENVGEERILVEIKILDWIDQDKGRITI
jgi:hypothetical protein